MNAKQAKHIARGWVETNLDQWPGLRAAHLVGGITSMADDAPFPASKDLDVHLVFDEGSPALQPTGPFQNMIEVSHGGISIEAGIKSAAEYASPEVVLANPEIAHHLMLDTLLYDPSGLLGDLQAPVRREYPRRRWVLARVEHERTGLAGALELLPMARQMSGAAGELNILGYSTTFLAATLCVATLNPPRMGGRMFVRTRQLLAEYDRLDLHDDALALLGVRDATPALVEDLLQEAAATFDLAVPIRKTPSPFGHKLHAHLRPYFVDACRSMIAAGDHREALAWVTPYHIATTDVMLVDGPETERPLYEERRARFLQTLGFDTAEARAARFAQANRLYDQVFALAAEIIAKHPRIVD